MPKYPDARAGTRIDAALLDEMLPLVVVKTADESRASTITMADDADLTAAVVAGTYEVEFVLGITGTAGDIVTEWGVPAGTGGFKFCLGPSQTSTSRVNTSMRAGTHAFATNVEYGVNDTDAALAVERGIATVTTAGSITLRWSQITSNAAPSSIVANSYMRVRRIA